MSATEYIVILARACGHGGKGAYHPDILTAYRAARSARFEYGEGG